MQAFHDQIFFQQQDQCHTLWASMLESRYCRCLRPSIQHQSGSAANRVSVPTPPGHPGISALSRGLVVFMLACARRTPKIFRQQGERSCRHYSLSLSSPAHQHHLRGVKRPSLHRPPPHLQVWTPSDLIHLTSFARTWPACVSTNHNCMS